MAELRPEQIQELGRRFGVDSGFLRICVTEQVVHVEKVAGDTVLSAGDLFRLRRLERLCHTFDMDVSAALLVLELAERVNALENELRNAHPQDVEGR